MKSWVVEAIVAISIGLFAFFFIDIVLARMFLFWYAMHNLCIIGCWKEEIRKYLTMRGGAVW